MKYKQYLSSVFLFGHFENFFFNLLSSVRPSLHMLGKHSTLSYSPSPGKGLYKFNVFIAILASICGAKGQ